MLNILIYFLIPEPYHSYAQRIEVITSFLIIFLSIEMLIAIDFDNEFLLWTVEVSDVGADGVLTLEFKTQPSAF